MPRTEAKGRSLGPLKHRLFFLALIAAVGCHKSRWAKATPIATPVTRVARNLARGSALRCVCDLCGGLPLEVWKSSVVLEHVRFRGAGRDGADGAREPAGSVEVLRRIIRERGPRGLYSGLTARMAEGALSGAILLAAKESIHRAIDASPMISKVVPSSAVGFISGAGGGAAQALVMAPCSLLVTATAANGGDVGGALRDILERNGIRGMYRGAPAVAARQMTNWASRQGFTELVRPRIGVPGVAGELLAGCVGGALSSWNTPFEVARIEAQSISFEKSMPETGSRGRLFSTLGDIVKERGVAGLYVGIFPRLSQACYQTVFMVCVPRILDN